jgi:thioredoxin-related protein
MRTVKYFRLIILFFLAGWNGAGAQQPDEMGSLVKWMTLQEAMEKVRTAPKPIILDFYTDWCGWCKHMMKTTYADPGLAQYINLNFYPVKFDAEGKDTIEYFGKIYKPTSPDPRRPHELAVTMLNGKLSYPSTVFLNGFDAAQNKFSVTLNAAGYLETQKIEPILIFVLENASRNCNYDDFRVHYEKAFFDSTNKSSMERLSWMAPELFFRPENIAQKKTMVMIDSEWCNACKVMRRTTFSDSLNLDYLSRTYGLVELNALSGENYFFNGKTMSGAFSETVPFNKLSMELCRNNLVLPMLVILDEQGKILDAIPGYITPRFLRDISHYYGDNIFKEKSWQDYTQSLYGK